MSLFGQITPLDEKCSRIDDEISLKEERKYWATDIIASVGGILALILFVIGMVVLIAKLIDILQSNPLLLWGFFGGIIFYLMTSSLMKVRNGLEFSNQCRLLNQMNQTTHH